MSTVQASTYDYVVSVTKSDTVDDPKGPFTGLFVSASGDVVVWNLNGPQAANPVAIAVLAGQYLRWPIKRISATGTTAGVFGLVSAVVRQGA